MPYRTSTLYSVEKLEYKNVLIECGKQKHIEWICGNGSLEIDSFSPSFVEIICSYLVNKTGIKSS